MYFTEYNIFILISAKRTKLWPLGHLKYSCNPKFGVRWFVLYSPFSFFLVVWKRDGEMPAWLKGFSRGNPTISLIFFFPFLLPTNSLIPLYFSNNNIDGFQKLLYVEQHCIVVKMSKTTKNKNKNEKIEASIAVKTVKLVK